MEPWPRVGRTLIDMVDADQPDERSLVRRLRAGDPAALTTLVRHHGEDLLRYLMSILHDRAEAEDAFQDTWVRVMSRAATIDPERPLRPWLLRVARNRAYDRLRWYRRWRRRVAKSLDPEAAVPDPPEPRDFREAVLARDAAGKLLGQLGPRQREVVWLRFYAQCSYDEISTLCGVPVGTVKSRLSRALAALGEGWRQLQEVPHEHS